MESTHLRSISEIVALVSILFSLIFVGLELRDNAAVARAEAYRETGTLIIGTMQDLAHNEELSTLMSRVFAGELQTDFTEQESFRITIFLNSVVQIVESRFRAMQSGLIPEIDPAENAVLGGGGFQNNFFRSAWVNGMQRGYAEDFVLYFEQFPWNHTGGVETN